MALSPMMKQYMAIKEMYKDCLLFYRLGDFYEMFFDDAITASRELELTLTGRDCGLEERAPMCGVPFHSVDSYIAKLIEKGYKVAICEQTTLPEESKGIVEREVTRIITPGTVIDNNMLDEGRNNYIACVFLNNSSTKYEIGLSWADISTGEFNFLEINEDPINKLNETLIRINPSEIICNEEMLAESYSLNAVKFNHIPRFNVYYEWAFNYENALKKISDNGKSLLINKSKVLAVRSLGALLEYLTDTQKRPITYLNGVNDYQEIEFLVIDNTERRNLELFETIIDRKKRGSLLGVIDKTKTSMGARMLRRWLEQPSINSNVINQRLDGVEELINNPILKENLTQLLSKINDIERLSSKIAYGTVNPRECVAISNSLKNAEQVIFALKDVKSEILHSIYDNYDGAKDIIDLIDCAIEENPPAIIRDGGIIKAGYNKELDTLRNAGNNAKQLIAALEAQEKESTGIKNLKIGFNKVFGFYIEVTKSQLDQVPYRYQRKQTIVNGERYITPELKDLESKILGSEEKAIKLEQSLYNEIIANLKSYVSKIHKIAQDISLVDCILSFAVVSAENNYVKPIINDNVDCLKIIEGRHPVVEKFIKDGEFVPNDTYLDNKDNRTLIITGPNMAGKSTYMRQVALITILGHMGCFVPAKEAYIPITDRIFTRIGASDDLTYGHSTFMVEMMEMSQILKNATSKSLLILDEIGRGTSTFDGLSIAWAVMEYVSSVLKAKTLFATHYHELTELEGVFEGVKNYRVLVKEVNKSILFLHKIVRGGANKSFGIEVASLAGLPKEVIEKARKILKILEENDINYNERVNALTGRQLSMFDQINVSGFEQIKNILEEVDINTITPVQAFEILADLKEKVKKL
ncbi:MAG TPA: DNA mismatch repair protein MutS [Clostridia bacterium]